MFHSNSSIILICAMCLWPGLVVDTRYDNLIKSLGSKSLLRVPTLLFYTAYFLFIKPNIMHYVLLRGQAISRSVPTANLLWIIFIVLQKLISCKFFCAIKLHLDFSYFKKLCSSLTHIFFRWWVPTFFC
jgi:hypothetical protein